MVKRFDVFKVDDLTKNTSGVLTGRFRAAKVGVYPYMDYNLGKVVMEAKLPEHMLKTEAISQLNHMPITDDHPWGLVNIGNTNELVKGLTANDAAVVSGEVSEVTGGVFDPVLAAKMLTGDQMECSLGFECDLLEQPGNFNGIPYDRIQTNYRYNHLAIVPAGRCGPDCKAVLDSAESDGMAFQLRMDSEGKPILPNNQRSDEPMRKVKIDSKEFEVADEVAARLDTLTADNERLTKDSGKIEGERDGWKTKHDAIAGELQTLKDNPPIKQDAIDKAVQTKIALVTDAALFGVEVKLDSTEKRTDRDVRIDCIKKVNAKFDATDKSDDYVNAVFDTLKADAEEANTGHSTGTNSLLFHKEDGDEHTKKIDKAINDRQNLKKS
jgi:hypothetical protein